MAPGLQNSFGTVNCAENIFVEFRTIQGLRAHIEEISGISAIKVGLPANFKIPGTFHCNVFLLSSI